LRVIEYADCKCATKILRYLIDCVLCEVHKGAFKIHAILMCLLK
jgi:hypothetical protein